MRWKPVLLLCAILSFSNLAAENDPPPSPGFQEGMLLLSAGTGTVFSAGGSLIQTERAYNLALKYRSLLSGSTINIGNIVLPPIIVPFSYDPSGSAQASLQYGLTNHFALGMKAESLIINSSQAEGFPYFLSSNGGYYRESIWPGSVHTLLFRGTSYMAVVGFHPLDHSRFDPYIEAQAGVFHYSSQAHSTIDFDPSRLFNRRSSGAGATGGLTLGTMFYLAPEIGLKIELSGYTRSIRSGLPSRMINTAQAEIGAVVNLAGMLKPRNQTREPAIPEQKPVEPAPETRMPQADNQENGQ